MVVTCVRRLVAVAIAVAAAGWPAGSARAAQAAGSGPEVFVTSSDLADALTPMPAPRFTRTRPAGLLLITVNEAVRYQRFAGLGAAMTDSSAWLLYDQLGGAARARVLRELFSAGGIRLSFLRVPMGASDFTVGGRPYSYDELPRGRTDPSLARFSIAHDRRYVIPVLRQALRTNPGIELQANPWSLPSWMKANHSLDNVGGRGALLTSDYGAAAQYFVKFIEAYARAGVPIAAITPQNEPRSGVGGGTSYPGMTLPAGAEATFVFRDLAPALSAAGLRVKVYSDDNSWDQLGYATRMATSLAGPDLAGIAWHCYFGSPAVMSSFHRQYPALDQIVNECSPELRPLPTPEFVISALRNWATSVALWNVALDPSGGPVQPPNSDCSGCSGVVTVDGRTHAVTLSQKYFQLGQVSRFVAPGAVRIGSPSFVSYGVNSNNMAVASGGIDDVAFVNPDGAEVLVVYDNSSSPQAFAVKSRRSYFAYRLAAGAMATFVWGGRAERRGR
jgi:glucosylceramidase